MLEERLEEPEFDGKSSKQDESHPLAASSADGNQPTQQSSQVVSGNPPVNPPFIAPATIKKTTVVASTSKSRSNVEKCSMPLKPNEAVHNMTMESSQASFKSESRTSLAKVKQKSLLSFINL